MQTTSRFILASLMLFAMLAPMDSAQAYNASCPPGKVMTGIQGKLGAYLFFWTVLGQVEPTCRSLTAEGSWVDDEEVGASGGTGDGDSWSLDCNPNHAVTGISGMEGDVVDSIEIQCSPIPTWMRASSSFPGMSDGPEGGGGGVSEYSDTCSGGYFGKSLTGDEGFGVINTIELECETVPWGLVQEIPINYFPAAEQHIANLTPEFQWSLIVNAHNYHLCVTRGLSTQFCDLLDVYTDGQLQAQFSYYTPPQALSMEDLTFASWKVQACNGAGVCGDFSTNTSYLPPVDDDDDVHDPDCACNTNDQCQNGCACDGDCPCVGSDVTFFNHGGSDLCSVYQNIRCQNCHSETFRERDTPTPPIGNHFPDIDAPNVNCELCHIKNHPGEWFTPANQEFEKPCFDICQDLQAWAAGHDIVQHLSTGFDPRIEWSFDPSGFSPNDHTDTLDAPAVTEMNYGEFISTSQAWIADGLCCALGAAGAGARTSLPNDRRGGDDDDQKRARRDHKKLLDELPKDFRRSPFPTKQIDPPRPDPRFSNRGLIKAVDWKGQPLSNADQRALRDAGLAPEASRDQVQAAIDLARSGATFAPHPMVRRVSTSGGRRLDRGLSVVPGAAQATSITLQGPNLDRVRKVRATVDGRPNRDLKIRVRRKSTDTLELEIQATGNAKIDTQYQIELETAEKRVAIHDQTFNVTIEAADSTESDR